MPAELITPVGGENQQSSIGQGMNSMADMLDHYTSCQRLERGQIVSGVVVHISPNEIIVDVGAKCDGVVPDRDLERMSPADLEAIRVGDEIPVCVINPEDDNGNVLLSLSRAQAARDWLEAQRLLESQETIQRGVRPRQR